MEVTVVLMRHKSEKLSEEQLEQATRHHGFMEINYWTLDDGKGPKRRIKELILKSRPDATSQPILKLTAPDQTQLKGDDMVYCGTEQTFGRDGDGRTRQARAVNSVKPSLNAGNNRTAAAPRRMSLDDAVKAAFDKHTQ